jgi:hypothetical protein
VPSYDVLALANHFVGGESMKTSSMLVRAGAVSLIVLAAGCSSTNWPRMSGGNQTSYATGSYPMPPKTAANTTAPAQARANGDATGHDTRVRTAAPVNEGTVVAAQNALTKFGYDPGNANGAYTPATQHAVEEFQKARGLRATGDLDASTLSALGIPQQ